MSRIDRLLKELSPDGVKYRELGELGRIYGGLTGKTKADFSGGNARYVSYINVFRNESVNLDDDAFVILGDAERQNRVAAGDVLFTSSSENAEDVGMSSVVTTEPETPLYLNSFCFGFRATQPEALLPGFSRHLFRSREIRRQIVRAASGVTRFNVSKSRFLGIRIPVPPVEVQREIQEILDTFTALETELEAALETELEARRAQFEFYRDAMLAFRHEPDVRWAKMSDVGQFKRGRRFTKADRVLSGIPSIHYGEIYTHYGVSATSAVSYVGDELRPTLRFAHPGDVVIASVGETVDDVGKAVAWLGDEDVAIHDDCFAFSHSMSPKFVSYYFQTAAFHAEKNKFVARAKVKRLSGADLGKLAIPVPALATQEHLVGILDQFGLLVGDLSVGLRAELVARRQQYEHYRDRLVTFEEATA